MTKYLPFLFILVLIGALAVSCQDNRGAEAWLVDRDSVLASVRQREDSAQRIMAKAEYLAIQADSLANIARGKALRGETAYRSALNYRDSVSALLSQTPDTPVSTVMALRAFDSLRVGYDSLRGAFVAVMGANAALTRANKALLHAYTLRGESIDSLEALVRMVPQRKWWVPEVQVGYGAVLSGGVVRMGPSLSVGIKVPF